LVIVPRDINGYRVNKQQKYRMQISQLFLTMKTP